MKNKRVCIITGVQGGLGRIVASRFLIAGHIVVGLDRGPDQLKYDHPNWSYIETDMLSESHVTNTFQELIVEFSKIDILINLVGGIYPWSDIEHISLDVWEKTISLNLRSTFLSCREAVKYMKPNKDGKIVNVGSQSGMKGSVQAGPYGAAKAGVINLTQTVAEEGKQHNIQCNAIVPSIIDTPANRKSMPNAEFSKWVSPLEIAEVIWFITSEESSGVTGAIIPVPGRV